MVPMAKEHLLAARGRAAYEGSEGAFALPIYDEQLTTIFFNSAGGGSA